MKGYTCVQFSKSTAKSNYDMIDREYLFIIKKIEDIIKKITGKLKELVFEVSFYSVEQSRAVQYNISKGNILSPNTIVEIKISEEELNNIVTTHYNRTFALVKHKIDLEYIKEEYSKFKRRFGKNIGYD